MVGDGGGQAAEHGGHRVRAVQGDKARQKRGEQGGSLSLAPNTALLEADQSPLDRLHRLGEARRRWARAGKPAHAASRRQAGNGSGSRAQAAGPMANSASVTKARSSSRRIPASSMFCPMKTISCRRSP